MQKKIALIHRHPKDRIKETNAAFPYLLDKGIDVLTFKEFDRTGGIGKLLKSLLWIFYAPILVIGKGYEVIYCDDSFPWYPALVKLASPRSKVIIRLGDFHLMYYTSGFLYSFLHFFEKIAWRMADGIISISSAMAWKMLEEGFITDVVLDPVNPKDFPFEHQYTFGTVMCHGLITKNKNFDMLLEAARRLPDVAFIIIGDGPDANRLKSIAPKNVLFYGWIPFKHIHRYIASCSVGVAMRSNNPGNEYVVTSPFIQYGIMGKPCLVTKRKVFGDYEWQFSDVDELVKKIQILLKAPWEEGLKLRKYILENHDAKKAAEEIWQILMQA